MIKIFQSMVLLLSIFFFTGCNSGNLTGTVTDISGQPIDIAHITIANKDGIKSTSTDALGYYAFSEVPLENTFTITVVKEGYLPVEQTLALTEAEVVLDFVLTLEQTAPKLGSVSGTINDVAGNPLSGVKVVSSYSQTLTDVNGQYILDAVAGQRVSITSDLNDYAQNSRNIIVEENITSTLDMTLVVVDAVKVFDVSTGVTINTKGARVELGASSIVNSDGSTYIGNVTAKVSFNQVTSSTGRKAFPGDYLGLETNGNETVLQSYGFIDVTLEDSNGNDLRLADGATATLVYPMDTNITATPATIPLWYYNTQTGIWVEDGLATYDAVTNTYTGSVSHFTTWNLDAKFDGAEILGCVEDVNGARVTNAQLYVQTPGWVKIKNNQDATGTFKFINAPSNLEMSIIALTDNMVSRTTTFTLAPGEVRNLGNCLVLDQEPFTEFAQVSGRVLNSDGTPASNNYIRLEDSGKYLGALYTDVNGYFQSSSFIRPLNNKITLSINVNSNGYSLDIDKSYSLDKFSLVTNLGNIQMKTSKVNGCVVRADGTNNFDRGGLISVNGLFNESTANIDANGNFSFLTEQNNFSRELFAFADNETLVQKRRFNANADIVDLSNPCMVLETATQINKTVDVNITSTTGNEYILVNYQLVENKNNLYVSEYNALLGGYSYPNGVYTLQEKLQNASFDLTKNGVYMIQSTSKDYSIAVSGSLSITIDGVTSTLNIPNNSGSEAWVTYGIEVFQGNITILELNQAGFLGEG